MSAMVSSTHNILGFDLGLTRTGVAIGQNTGNSARPLSTLAVSAGKLNWPDLDTLIARWSPILIVLGKIDSSQPHLYKFSRRFKHHIQQHKIPIAEVNESYSTEFANSELQQLQTKRPINQGKKIQLRDQIAACLILESYLSTNHPPS